MTLLLHPSTKLQLSAALPASSGAVIFHGPAGVGKFSTALELVRTRNCLKEGVEGCICRHCTELAAGAYPDLIILAPQEKTSIGVEIVRELVQKLSLAPYYDNSVRFVIVDQAERLTPQAQNAFLKLIEEPPVRTNIVLAATDLESMLVTVRSRCRQVHFPALQPQLVADWLVMTQGIDAVLALDYAELSSGAIGSALGYVNDESTREGIVAIASVVEDFFGSPLFERLRSAKILAEYKGRYPLIISQLHRKARERIAGSAAAAPNELIGVERLQAQLNANVSPRSAFERFALGVGQ